jgi:hypothetical protein
MTTNAPLAHALAFARRGLAVFPLNWPVVHRGHLICSCSSDLRGRPCGRDSAKHPFARLAPNGVYSASTDESRIREWFRDVPDANLGVHADGLIVVDVDPRDGGDESWRALESEHGEVPPTWRVITGSKGEHIYFQCPSGVVVTNVAAKAMTNPPLGPGVDVRTTGGYLVAPPSRHISGGVYDWSVDHHPQDVALAPAPEWLIARLNGRAAADEHTDAPPSEDWQQLTRPVLAYPDMAAASVAGHLLRRWVDPFLVAGLLHAWNQAYVAPPLPDDELRRILNRIARREDQRRDALKGGNHA